jgi:hypothetical protein
MKKEGGQSEERVEITGYLIASSPHNLIAS